MKIVISAAGLFLLLVGGGPPNAIDSDSNAFQDLMRHYEAIRLALLSDTVDDVALHARAIEERALLLSQSFSARDAGVTEERSTQSRELLPEVSKAAARLAAADDLPSARDAFFELSKPLGRYRKLAGVEGSMVVFCPMKKKAWIQPHGDFGNPYLGGEMPTCGERVPD